MVTRNGKSAANAETGCDHRQVAFEMYGDWITSPGGERRAMRQLAALSKWDAVLVMLEFMDHAEADPAGPNLKERIARRADRERGVRP